MMRVSGHISRSLNNLKIPLRFAQVCYASTTNQSDAKETDTYHRPQYATRDQYQSQLKDNRAKRVVDEHSGVKVTASKKLFLVVTGLYKWSDVPEYVPSSIVNRLGDRFRVLFIVFFIAFFFSIFLISELGVVKGIEQTRQDLGSKSPK